MCLVVPEKQYKREILEEDMTVYKLFRSKNGMLLSPIHYMKWVEGELYSSNIMAATVSVGSFIDDIDELYYQIAEGLHSFENPPLTDIDNALCRSLKYEFGEELCEKPCIIPKGSVIVRHGGHVVSNKLKLKK